MAVRRKTTARKTTARKTTARKTTDKHAVLFKARKRKQNRLNLGQHVQVVDFLKKHKKEIEHEGLIQPQVAIWASKELGFSVGASTIAYCSKYTVQIKWKKSNRIKSRKFYTRKDGIFLESALAVVIRAIVELHKGTCLYEQTEEDLEDIYDSLEASAKKYVMVTKFEDDEIGENQR